MLLRPLEGGFPIRLLLAASEVVGFAKTGGLADVAGSLPIALAARGHDCAVIMPLYSSARHGDVPLRPTGITFQVPISGKPAQGEIWQSHLPDTEVPVYLIANQHYFERDDHEAGRGLYQEHAPDGTLTDYPDNCERFTFFCRGVLEAIRLLAFWPDILHLNDWQTGLIPVYLREEYLQGEDEEIRHRYQNIRTLFTVHNIAYQGIFWHWDMMMAGLSWKLFNFRQLEYHGNIGLLKAGLIFSDFLSTVSPTYANEIQTAEHGQGLEGVLGEKRDHLFGIVNGVDYHVWNPETDPHIPAHFTAEAPGAGKATCKAALQKRLGLAAEPQTPVLAIIARLVEQKGIDLVLQVAEEILAEHTQLVVLGDGELRYKNALLHLAEKYPRQVSLTQGQEEPLAHQIEAGADIFLMPSLYEPCGLNQLYSMKYGTLPVTRITGGLADTVVDTSPASVVAGIATGFSFGPYEAGAFLATVKRALSLYRGQPDRWLQVMHNAMTQDWSWSRSATQYERLFRLMRE